MTAGVLNLFFGLIWASTIRPKDRKEQKKIRMVKALLPLDVA
jgi:hypothetical protein